MAKVKVSFDPQKFEARVREAFTRVKTNNVLQKEIGQFLVDRIKGEARRARPLNKTRSFPPLKTTTVTQRGRLAKYNSTHPTFKQSRSNLTLTGQLIDAVGFEPRQDFVEVRVKDTRRKAYVTGADGQRQKIVPSNLEVAQFVSEKGFQLFDAQGIRGESKIVQGVKSRVIKFLRRALNVARLRS